MSDSKKDRRISHAIRQFELHKVYALYWQAVAVTGAAKLRNTEQGRETDEEKVKDALDASLRHIHSMNDCDDTISELMWEDEEDELS